MTDPAPLSYAPPAGRVGHARWVVCGLLFFATTVSYMDRQVIALLKPVLARDLHWTDLDYTRVVQAFQIAYAAGYLLSGRLVDVIGVRAGLAVAVAVWSAAAAGHGLARTVAAFVVARLALGLAEGANFPAAMKAVGEWFPRRERALATGIFNAGSNIGATVTPAVVPWLTARYGWPAAFVAVAAVGLVWLAFWLALYRRPDRTPWLSAAERAYIADGDGDGGGDGDGSRDVPVHLPWRTLLTYRATWAIMIAMTLTNPVWWFYLFWGPDVLYTLHHLDLRTLGPPLVAVYLMADAGSFAGGFLSSWLIRRGYTVNAARKLALLACATCVLPAPLVVHASHLWAAAGLIGLLAAAHQGWSANTYTLAGDVMPKSAVASVVGLACMPGAVAGLFFAQLVGYVKQTTGSYAVPFALAPLAYFGALAAIQLLMPRIEPVRLSPPRGLESLRADPARPISPRTPTRLPPA